MNRLAEVLYYSNRVLVNKLAVNMIKSNFGIATKGLTINATD